MLQQIGFATIKRSPIKLWSEKARVCPEPNMIRITPRKDKITPWMTRFVTFSTSKAAPNRIMKIGVVARISAELVAVVSAIPLMKKSW